MTTAGKDVTPLQDFQHFLPVGAAGLRYATIDGFVAIAYKQIDQIPPAQAASGFQLLSRLPLCSSATAIAAADCILSADIFPSLSPMLLSLLETARQTRENHMHVDDGSHSLNILKCTQYRRTTGSLYLQNGKVLRIPLYAGAFCTPSNVVF